MWPACSSARRWRPITDSRGTSVLARLEELYGQYGRWLHKVDSFAFEGLSGMDTMKAIMAKLRTEGLHEVAGRKVVKAADYQAREVKNMETGAVQPTGPARLKCAHLLAGRRVLRHCAPLRHREPTGKGVLLHQGRHAGRRRGAAQAQLAAAVGPLLA